MDRQGLAYLHFGGAEWGDALTIDVSFLKDLRRNFPRTLIVTGRYDLARANAVLDKGYADLVAFGRSFITNPDLPARLQKHWPLNELQPLHCSAAMPGVIRAIRPTILKRRKNLKRWPHESRRLSPARLA